MSQRLPLVVAATQDARAYLRTKALRMAHVLPPESYTTAAEANAAAEAIAVAESLAAAAEALANAGSPSSEEGKHADGQQATNGVKAAAAAADDGGAETFMNPQDGKEHTWALGRASAEAAIAAVARGELVAVTDDEVCYAFNFNKLFARADCTCRITYNIAVAVVACLHFLLTAFTPSFTFFLICITLCVRAP